MTSYTVEEHVQMIKLFYHNECSPVKTLRALRPFYDKRSGPSKSTLQRLVAKFEKTGSVNNQPALVRQRNARSAVNIAAVRESVQENPTQSIPRLAQELGLSQTSTWRILRRDLGLHPEMKKHKIVPDVIPVAPPEVAYITYPNGVSVEQGNILTPTMVKGQPTVQWNAEPDAFYTLCMTNPDAPSRKNPKFREWNHWLVGNIPGSNVSKGEVLSAYIGSAPPQGSGLHRYVFLIYKQNGKLKFAEIKLMNKKSSGGRAGFQIQKIAEKYKLGEPVAGNFFQAEYDDYVPENYKEFMG